GARGGAEAPDAVGAPVLFPPPGRERGAQVVHQGALGGRAAGAKCGAQGPIHPPHLLEGQGGAGEEGGEEEEGEGAEESTTTSALGPSAPSPPPPSPSAPAV